MKQLRRFTGVLFVVATTCGSCNSWAQVNEPGKSWHYMENPVLPAPPIPTEEQLKRGEDLLNTLLKIASNVRLTDSAAVMRELGVDELNIQRHSDHLWITPKHPTDEELRKRGFESMNLVQLHDPYQRGGRSRLSISLHSQITCVTPQAMERKLENIQRSLWTRPETHPTPKPPKKQPLDGVLFSPLDTPDGRIGSISAEFAYQECAESIDFGYPSLKS
jgi:hypothetical protein